MVWIVLVCHCHAVSERRIRKAVRSGSRCLGSIARSCGAGAGCGGCRSEVALILERELSRAEFASEPVATSELLEGALAAP